MNLNIVGNIWDNLIMQQKKAQVCFFWLSNVEMLHIMKPLNIQIIVAI